MEDAHEGHPGKDPKLSPEEDDELILEIARRLTRLVRGNPDEPEAWRRVARKLGCQVDIFRDPTLERFGDYAPDPDVPGRGLLTVNTSQPPATQVRVLWRLLAHHLRHYWIPELAESAPE
jgi:hypothetical protein